MFSCTGEMTDNCACNVYKLGGSLVASTETCLLRRIDAETLDTNEKIDLSGMVNIASARALTDPKTKDVFNITGTFLKGLKYHFVKFPASKTHLTPKELLSSGSIVATINSRMTTCFSYYHSFGMTDKYLIMIEQPWVANRFFYDLQFLRLYSFSKSQSSINCFLLLSYFMKNAC